jgi:hypothetical protein
LANGGAGEKRSKWPKRSKEIDEGRLQSRPYCGL